MRHLRRVGWAVALCVAAVLAIRSFVGDLYRISSPSMEPELRTGEWVWVRFDRSAPRRGEVIVLDKRGELLVKRVAGLGGESVQVRDGDVWIDGAPLPPGAGRGEPVLLYDQERTPLEEAFDRGSSGGDPWREVQPGVWELDGREVPLGSQAGLLRYVPEVLDGWPGLGDDGQPRMAERRDVGDVLLEARVQVLEAAGRLRAILVERGERFTLSVDLGGEDAGKVEFLRRDGEGLRTLWTGRVDLTPGEWTTLRFENVDDHLRGRLGDQELGPVPTGPNTYHASDRTRSGLSYGNRVMLGGEGCRLRLAGLRLWRDQHHEPRGEFGVERPLPLGRDQLYVLGDNSPASRDSRAWGPIERGDVVGRVVGVVWPPRAWRLVRRREE